MSLTAKALKSIARGQITNGEGAALTLDEATNTLVILSFPHHEIHEGDSFSTFLTTDDLDSNPLRISFITPANGCCAHALIGAAVSGQAILEIREAPTGGVTGGSTLTPLNRNRNSLNTSILKSTHGTPTAGIITQGAAAGTGGIVLQNENLGQGLNKQAGQARDTSEWVFKRDTKYIIELTSSTNLIIADLSMNWYEHETM